MPQRCIVGGCDSVYGKGNIKTTFHQLPFDNEKRELWISVIQDWSGLRHLRKDSRLTTHELSNSMEVYQSNAEWLCSHAN